METTLDVQDLIEKMEKASQAFVLIDYQFTYIHVNALAEAFYGKTHHQLVGRNVKDIFPDQWNFGPFIATRKCIVAKSSFTSRYHSPFAKSWVELKGEAYESFYTFTYRAIDHKEVLRDELRSELGRTHNG